ncbi:MAG: hypothetical protein U0P82_11275 [Vicinamibacterales bacterium]
MVRLLALLLIVWEPLNFAAAAAGAFNAISVRGTPVAVVLLARFGAAGLCIAAGRALLDRRPSAPLLVRAALGISGIVQVIALVTPWFPSNRIPGDTSLYVIWVVVYYGALLAFTRRSAEFKAMTT